MADQAQLPALSGKRVHDSLRVKQHNHLLTRERGRRNRRIFRFLTHTYTNRIILKQALSHLWSPAFTEDLKPILED
jgi:hypothetical protein